MKHSISLMAVFLALVLVISAQAADSPSDPMLGSTHRASTNAAPDLLSGAQATPSNQKVDPALCRALVNHTPRADVAYQAGVDAQGKPVAPADLPGNPQPQLPAKIQIPVTVGLAQALHADPTSYPYNQFGAGTEASLGTITVESNTVSFNGQPLSGAQQDNLAVLCLQPH